MAKELGVSVYEEDDKLNLAKKMNQGSEDPYLNLGFGIVAYFRMIRTMIVLFLIFTILQIPALVIYSNHDGLEGL